MDLLFRVLVVFLTVVLVVWFVRKQYRKLLSCPLRVCGPSMSPTLRNGDHVTARKILFPRLHRFEVGKIYSFIPENVTGPGVEAYYIKRLDHIEEDGKLFFIGDNKNNSFDSRKFGAVDRRCVKYVVTRICHTQNNTPLLFKNETEESGNGQKLNKVLLRLDDTTMQRTPETDEKSETPVYAPKTLPRRKRRRHKGWQPSYKKNPHMTKVEKEKARLAAWNRLGKNEAKALRGAKGHAGKIKNIFRRRRH